MTLYAHWSILALRLLKYQMMVPLRPTQRRKYVSARLVALFQMRELFCWAGDLGGELSVGIGIFPTLNRFANFFFVLILTAAKRLDERLRFWAQFGIGQGKLFDLGTQPSVPILPKLMGEIGGLFYLAFSSGGTEGLDLQSAFEELLFELAYVLERKLGGK
jgi:hypothetical protein